MNDWKGIARSIRSEVRDRFVELETKQLVTYTEQWKKGYIPTPEEAAQAIPNGPSYSTGIEDGALRGGAMLASLCDEYDLGADDEVKALAHTLFEGLQRAQDLADPPGFVPRWMLSDGKTCYPNSSGDQHTILIYGLWRYVKSPMATDAHKRAAAAIAGRVLTRIREQGWRIASRDGTDAHAGGRLASTRLLGVLLGTYRITGNPMWLDIYEEKAAANLEQDVRTLLGDGPGTPSGWGFYGPQQQSELLTILVQDDPNEERRALFQRTRVEIAERFLLGPIPTEHHCPTYSEECALALGDAAHIPTPFDALSRFKPALWGIDEDRDWRRDFGQWTGEGHEPGPTPYIVWWLGKRPALCHERNCVISPLVAFHICLLCGDPALAQRVRDPIARYLDAVDLTRAGKVGSLTGAHAVAVLSAKAAAS